MTTLTINLKDYESPAFDEKVAYIDCWYDRHERLWVLQKMNKEGYQIGNATYIWGKKDALEYKKQMEKEEGLC